MQTEAMQTHDMALVDEIRSRMDATYTEALAALNESEGDLLSACAIVEQNRTAGSEEAELIDRIFTLAEEEIEAVRVKVGKRYEKVIPIGMGVMGSLLAAAAIGLLSEISVQAIRRK